MLRISDSIIEQCRKVLLECDETTSDKRLKNIFITEKLQPFQAKIQDAGNRAERVENLLSFLLQKKIGNEYILLIFLETLRRIQSEGDGLCEDLDRCITEIQKELSGIHGFIHEFPTSKIAFSLNAKFFKLMPVDLGTIWGLQRSSFIDIISGFKDDGVYENLLNVEFAFSEAIETSQHLIALQKRKWIRIEFDTSLNSLPNLTQILKNNTISNFNLLGIFLDISSKKNCDELSKRICQWCDILLHQTSFRQEIAIVIHINSEVDDDRDNVIEDIEHNLKNIAGFSIDVMRLECPKSHFDRIFTTHLSTYLRNKDIQAYYRQGIVMFTHADLVSDLLFDRWIDPINYQNNEIDDRIFFGDEESIHNPIVEGLVLAWLRKYQINQTNSYKNTNENIVNLLKKWEPYLSKSLKVVCKLSLKEISEDDFLSHYGANEFILAIRAKIKFSQVLSQFKKIGVKNPPLCWLLSTMPLSRDSIIELLKLDKEKRAVFGLCTIEEWQEIQEDRENEYQISDCRRKRQLIYRNGN